LGGSEEMTVAREMMYYGTNVLGYCIPSPHQDRKAPGYWTGALLPRGASMQDSVFPTTHDVDMRQKPFSRT
jgi:hypothetical protein